METIGTGRTARILLSSGISEPIDLERGFAQGNSPSPRKYNIGEQIVIFKIEYDPRIQSVYNSHLIPRQVAALGGDPDPALADVQQAERKGLLVDKELKHTNRKANAFADDTTCGLRRTPECLSYVKTVLEQFGSISGLETNIEKTTLMPIGNLEEPLDPLITELGFTIVTSMKSLGITVNNRGTDLESVFEDTIEKVWRLALKWSRFTLSLPGRIAISKTMLVSQVGYVGCIIMPKADQLVRLHSILDRFATTGTIIARDRLYTKPKEGGLGLIN